MAGARNIGGMRHRVTIKVINRQEDELGGFVRADTAKDPIWASIEPATPREVYAYSQLQQRVTHRMTVRYRTDIRQGMTLEHDGTEYYVTGVTNPDKRKRFLEVMCREGGSL